MLISRARFCVSLHTQLYHFDSQQNSQSHLPLSIHNSSLFHKLYIPIHTPLPLLNQRSKSASIMASTANNDNTITITTTTSTTIATAATDPMAAVTITTSETTTVQLPPPASPTGEGQAAHSSRWKRAWRRVVAAVGGAGEPAGEGERPS